MNLLKLLRERGEFKAEADLREAVAELRRAATAPTKAETELRVALEASVKLQSHYAKLLNMHDGGERMDFADAEAWMARLRQTGKLPK